jgi:hypothetical protein
MLGGVLLAARHFDLQHNAPLGHQIAVINMRRAAALGRVVTDLGSLRMTVERLDRRIDIQDPRLAQQRPHAILQLLAQPADPGRLVDLAQRPPYRVRADHLFHSQQRRVDRFGAQRRDVRVAPVPGQHRQQHRAQHVALGRRVRASQVQRAARDPAVEQTPCFRYSMKKASWPIVVIGAAGSHSR